MEPAKAADLHGQVIPNPKARLVDQVREVNVQRRTVCAGIEGLGEGESFGRGECNLCAFGRSGTRWNAVPTERDEGCEFCSRKLAFIRGFPAPCSPGAVRIRLVLAGRLD
jgi:hypothetical protein